MRILERWNAIGSRSSTAVRLLGPRGCARDALARRSVGGVRGCNGAENQLSTIRSSSCLSSSGRQLFAVWDFCRAVDDRGGREFRLEPRRPLEKRCSSGVGPSSRAATMGRRRPRRKGSACSRLSRASICRGRRSTMSLTGWRWTSTRRVNRTFDDLFEYCPPRRVGGGFDLHQDLSAAGTIAPAIMRSTWAWPCSSPTSFAISPTIWPEGRVYLPLDDLAVHGCTVDDLANGVVTDSGCGACSRSSAWARARVLSRRFWRGRTRTAAGWWPPRLCEPLYFRDPPAHRTKRL